MDQDERSQTEAEEEKVTLRELLEKYPHLHRDVNHVVAERRERDRQSYAEQAAQAASELERLRASLAEAEESARRHEAERAAASDREKRALRDLARAELTRLMDAHGVVPGSRDLLERFVLEGAELAPGESAATVRCGEKPLATVFAEVMRDRDDLRAAPAGGGGGSRGSARPGHAAGLSAAEARALVMSGEYQQMTPAERRRVTAALEAAGRE